MFFDILPNEIVTHVFHSLSDISSVLDLASTCHHFHDVYQKQKLSILTQAADAELGPIDDIVQIVTQNTSQPAHIHRNVPMSDALLKDVWRVGKVAQQWEDVYPFKKWKNDYSARRLLTPAERYTLRRAIYRVWLFSAAFHTRQYIRTSRNLPHIVHERALLLHNFSTVELSEMLDVHCILKDVIANNICPSNGKIRQKFHKRYPESNHQLLFNIHLNYPPPPTEPFLASRRRRRLPSRFHEPGGEGWGDDISHFYVVEDMAKLDPGQILFLKERAPLKQQVDMWLRTSLEGGVEWFLNNGETFSETLGFVIRQRGGDMEALRDAVAEGEMGVAVLEAEM
ncbi:hypothetical protein KC356_g1566 [Hortaea werneckii]|nr:hypothetical protein KC356_g1566 [Hortaea werneckii]